MTPALAAWLPKSVLMLRDYDRHKFLSDLIAGITVGLVALPLATAFAIASGLSPQAVTFCRSCLATANSYLSCVAKNKEGVRWAGTPFLFETKKFALRLASAPCAAWVPARWWWLALRRTCRCALVWHAR